MEYKYLLCMTQFIAWSWQNASQKGGMKNVLENFHVQLHICIFKVIKWPIIWDNSIQSFEVTHNSQLCDACVYKNLHPLIMFFTELDCI
jgi:hypothetical protein